MCYYYRETPKRGWAACCLCGRTLCSLWQGLCVIYLELVKSPTITEAVSLQMTEKVLPGALTLNSIKEVIVLLLIWLYKCSHDRFEFSIKNYRMYEISIIL